MPRSIVPYASSSPLRIELRASRWLPVALLALAAGVGLALWLSAAPRWALLAVPALLAAAWPRPPAGVALRLRGDGTGAIEDGAGIEYPVEHLRLQRRGPLTLVGWREPAVRAPGALRRPRGRGYRSHAWFPDTLSEAQARRLRLWFDRHHPLAERHGMLPHV